MKDYLELKIDIEPRQPGADLLISELADAGCESFTETETGILAYIQEDTYSDNIAQLLNEFDPEIGRIVWEKQHIPGKNWNEEWEAGFQPVSIDHRLIIRAPFHPKQQGFEMELIIQPQQSFGTGHHQTTRLMAEQLMALEVNAKRVMDMGCGTGVLAILAAKLGASLIEGVDIEEHAVENARENAELNQATQVRFFCGVDTFLEGKTYDILLANINKNILKAAMPAYAKALTQGGKLLLSGFFETDADELLQVAAQNGLVFEELKTLEGWALLQLIKA